VIASESIQGLAEAIASSLERSLAPLRRELARLAARIDASSPATPPREVREAAPAAAVTAPRSAPRSNAAASAENCIVPDCEALVLAKQLCETHYRIMRRAVAAGETFDPQSQRPARARVVAKTCSEPDCSEAHYAKGLCRRHYMAERSRIRSGRDNGSSDESMARDVAEEPHINEYVEVESRSNGGGSNGHADGAIAETPHRAEPAAAVHDPRLRGVPNPFAEPESPKGKSDALPTAEMVARVVAQYRGGLDRVAEVLGRNKRTLFDLLDRLDLMPYVTRIREQERRRIETAELPERLADLLFREKLLDDLGCLKDVDDRARFEVKMRCANLAKRFDSVEDVLEHLAQELKLEEAGLKRLVWRYDLRRHLRGLNLKATAPPPTRVRS
jgi:hypothetical protein